MGRVTDDRRRSPALIVILIGLLTLFAGFCVYYARLQNVWVDETTQLSGMTLRLGDLIGWLTGDLKLPLGVPEDRMPPFSYLVDMIGWHIWGINVLAFRLYHAALVACGLGFLIAATGRRFGIAAALITGLTLVLSPKLIETAVEIRAYPIFFALSCAQVAMLVRGGVAGNVGRLALFLALGVASIYTHFFGVVSTSAFFVAAFVSADDLRAAIRVIAAYAILLLCALGLAPFIFGATSISGATVAPSSGPGALLVYLLQLISNSAILIQPAVAALYFAGAALILLLALASMTMLVGRKGLDARHDPAIAIAIGLLSGIIVTIGASFLVKGFESLSPRYSIWMFPAIAVLIGAAASGALAPTGRIATWLRIGALALFGVGAALGVTGFLNRAEWFVHGPSTMLEAMIGQGEQPIAIVHVGPAWQWGYFPLNWRHQQALAQWALLPGGHSVARLDGDKDALNRPQPLSALNGYATLLVSRVELKDYHELRDLTETGIPPPPASLAPSLGAAGWTGSKAIRKPGNFSFTGQLYRRAERSRPAPPVPRETD